MAGGGRVVLVTGAQQGIGRSMAVAFAAAGDDVVINWLDDRSAAEQVAAQVKAHGRDALLVQADINQVAQVRAMVDQAAAWKDRLDVLINNAGVYPRVPFLDMTEAEWDLVIGVNLKGANFCAQAAARAMLRRSSADGTIRGSIINISSRSMGGAPLGVHYSATKAGLVGLTRSIAMALAPDRIRVNAIAPGLTDTAQPRYGNTEPEIQEMGRATPLGRMGTPEDIARLGVFLASDDASWITGQVYHINGGSYMG